MLHNCFSLHSHKQCIVKKLQLLDIFANIFVLLDLWTPTILICLEWYLIVNFNQHFSDDNDKFNTSMFIDHSYVFPCKVFVEVFYPFFKKGLLHPFIIDLLEFITYSGFNSFVRYVLWIFSLSLTILDKK